MFYFAENLREFAEKNFGDESIDNLLEINENVFEEMVSNGVDIYEQNQKYEFLKKKTSGNVEIKNEDIDSFVIYIFFLIFISFHFFSQNFLFILNLGD